MFNWICKKSCRDIFHQLHINGVKKHRLQTLQFQFLESSWAKMTNVNPSASHWLFTTDFSTALLIHLMYMHARSPWTLVRENIGCTGGNPPSHLAKNTEHQKDFLDMKVEQYHFPMCTTMYALPKIGEQTLCMVLPPLLPAYQFWCYYY